MINNGNLEKEDGEITYEIRKEYLILCLNKAEIIFFKPNNNIINKDCYLGEEYIFQKEIDIIYKSIQHYYKFEQSLIKEINDNNNSINKYNYEGYLIEKKWIDKWKKYSDYNKIILKDINNDKDQIIKLLKEKYIENELLKLDDIKPIKFKHKKDLIEYLNKKEILILVNDKFFDLFNKNKEYNKYKIIYSLKYRQILFDFSKKDFIESHFLFCYNNIISLKIDKCFKIVNKLIELLVLQEKLKLAINQNKEKKNQKNYKLVDKKWIENIKNKYNYNILNELYDKIKKDLNNQDQNYFLNKIINNLDNKFFNNICFNKNEKNKDEETKKFGLEYKDKKIEFNNKKNKEKKIKYIDNVELIDSNLFNDITSIIEYKDKDKISKDIIYYTGENKLLIEYEIEKDNKIYVIGFINENNSFSSEYLIEGKSISKLKESLNQQGIKLILNNLKENNSFEYYKIYNDNAKNNNSNNNGMCIEIKKHKKK